MMVVLRAIAVLLLLVGVLTWLLLDGAGPPGEAYVFAQRDVARVSLAEATLRGDVLQARAGLLRNYDPLVADMQDLQTSAAELHEQARVRPVDHRLLEEIVDVVNRDDAALERFKTDNALLQNSLSQFDGLDTQLANPGIPPKLSTAIAALGNSVLQLTRNPSPQCRQNVWRRVETVRQLEKLPDDAAPWSEVDLLVTHALVLARQLPAVDEDLHRLFMIDTFDLRQQIRRSQDRRRLAEEARAGRYRRSLYALALALLVVLWRVGTHWRKSLQLLRQRAELELLIADISTSFVVSSYEAYDAVADRMLARLGGAFQADRAYLALPGSCELKRLWCAPGVAAPSLWPATVLAPALEALGSADGVIEAPMVAALASVPMRELLIDHGVSGWCGVALHLGDGRTGLLGFDRVRPVHPWPRGGGGMVRMAGEVVQNALQRRQAAEDRLRLEQRLARSRRLETLGTFASGIAHNFNNVVGVVLGHAEMAAEALPPDADAASYHVSEVSKAGRRAQDLVGRILDFSARGATHHYMTLSIPALVEETLAMLRVLLPAHTTFTVATQSADGLTGSAQQALVRGDAVHLQQVLVNLVRNAAEATEAGGSVTLRIDTQELTAPYHLSHDSLSPGRYIRLRVADTGVGMSADTLSHIFQPFFTTRPAGTGLGLATAREVIHDHDGAIDIASVRTQGTTITVWLPALEGDVKQATPDVQRHHRGTGQIVMLVGVGPEAAPLYEEMLAALGYEPVSLGSLDVAMVALQERPRGFDAAIVDLPRPDSSSLAKLSSLSHAGRLPVVLVTSLRSLALSPEEQAALGVCQVLPGPLHSAALADALTQCLEAVS